MLGSADTESDRQRATYGMKEKVIAEWVGPMQSPALYDSVLNHVVVPTHLFRGRHCLQGPHRGLQYTRQRV